MQGCKACLVQSLAFAIAGLSAGCSFDTSTPGFDLGWDANLATADSGVDPDVAVGQPDASLIDAGITDAAAIDAAVDATPDAAPDAACIFDVVELCLQGTPDGPLNLGASLDTDTDPLCRSFTPVGGTETCLVLVESATQSGATSVIGSRPLMLVATGKIEIAGDFNISSQRGGQTGAGANFSACAATSDPQNDRGGAGGGAGGSFAGTGGNGGTGDEDTSLGNDGDGAGGVAGAAVATPSVVRGGCPGTRGGHEGNQGDQGKGGRGGNGGGAVHLVAGGELALLSGGQIRATGAGGIGGEVQSGGGGGGAGGYVRMDAPTITWAGNISANGGGGGEGGLRLSNGNPAPGNPGADGTISAGDAPGGSGASGNGGDGGNGSLQADANASAGAGATGGAGGGGGAGGFILVRGALTFTGNSSPFHTVLP